MNALMFAKRMPGAPTCVAVTFLIAAACGGSTPSSRTLPREVDLLGIAPANAYFVAYIDVDRARHSPHFGTVVTMLDDLSRAQGGSSIAATREILERTETIVVIAQHDDEDRVIVLMRGSYRQGELEGAFREAARDPVRTTRRGAHEVLVGERAEAGYIDTRTWAVTSTGTMGRILARADGHGGPSATSTEAFRALGRDIGFTQHAMTWFAIPTPELRERLFARAQGSGWAGSMVAAPIAAEARWLGGFVDVERGVELAVVADMRSAQAAGRAAEYIQQEASGFAGSLFANMLGLSPLLSRTRVRADGARVTLGLRGTNPEVETVLSRVGGLLALALQSGAIGGASTAPPPPPPSGEPAQ